MAMRMLEYFTRDQEALHGLRGPWFPPISSRPGPVNMQLMAISEHDFVRSEQTPNTFTLHHVSPNGTRVEYLVRLIAMEIVPEWSNEAELALDPGLIHDCDGHENRWTQASYRHHNLVHGHQPPRYFDRLNRRLPARTLRAQPELYFARTEQSAIWYDTSFHNLPDESDMNFRWVSHHPRTGDSLVVNTWSPDSFVATYFKSSGVPVTYNLAIYCAYIQQRHSEAFDTEVASILRRWSQVPSIPQRHPTA
jgi:hypothetical protein